MQDEEDDLMRKYWEVIRLVNEADTWFPRLDKIHEIVQQPDFHYAKEAVARLMADEMISNFVCSSYWLDKEVFSEGYLYTKEKQFSCSPGLAQAHLKMVDIGVSLLNKGFTLKYNPDNFKAPDGDLLPLASWVKVFVEQCYKKHSLCHKVAHRKGQKIVKDNPNIRE